VSYAHRNGRFAPIEKNRAILISNKAFALFGAAKLRIKSLKNSSF